MPRPEPSAAPTRGYFAQTRSWTYAAALALPVMLAYELSVRGVDTLLGTPVRNGADAMLRGLIAHVGWFGSLALPLAVAAVLLLLAFWERGKVALRQRWLALSVLEAFGYALFFGGVVGRITALFLPHSMGLGTGVGKFPLWAEIVLSLGAGFYEEVLFRGLLLGALRRLFGLFVSGALLRDGAAVLLAAAIFSAYHHVGPYGDPFTLGVFAFRMVAGLLLSALLVLRGFGITVLTHAFYDVLVSLGLAL